MFISFCKKHPILFVFSLAVVARIVLLLIFSLPDQTGGDLPLYQRIADSILTQGNFGGEPQKSYGSPSITPGFAFFLAGYGFFFGKSVAALVAASVVFGGLLAVGTYLLATLFFERRVALIAGVASSLWPVFLIQTFKYGSSILLYSVLLLFGTYFLVRAARGAHLASAMLAGALLGFAALVDAIGFFIPSMLIVWLFFEHRSWRSAYVAAVFLIAVGLVIAPWTYRNYTVSHVVEQREIPIIAKDELKRVIPSELSYMAKLAAQQGVLVSGLSKMYVFPYDISVLDQKTVATEAQRNEFSYKVKAHRLIRGEAIAFSSKEIKVLVVKIAITIFHWLMFALAAIGFVILARMRGWSYPLLTLLLTGYVTAAVIGFGSLSQDDFQSISGPNSFLFPLIPFVIVLASYAFVALYIRMRRYGVHTETKAV